MAEYIGHVFAWLAYGLALLLLAGAFYAWTFHAPNVGAALFLSGILAG